MKSEPKATGAGASYMAQSITCVYAASRQLNTATPPCQRLHHHPSLVYAGLHTLFDVSLRVSIWLEPAPSHPLLLLCGLTAGNPASLRVCIPRFPFENRHGGASSSIGLKACLTLVQLLFRIQG